MIGGGAVRQVEDAWENTEQRRSIKKGDDDVASDKFKANRPRCLPQTQRTTVTVHHDE